MTTPTEATTPRDEADDDGGDNEGNDLFGVGEIEEENKEEKGEGS
jgi:hypothetical protein